MLSPHMVLTASSTTDLRVELRWLRARYDSGAVAPSVYRLVKNLEVELAWREHARPADRVSGPSPTPNA